MSNPGSIPTPIHRSKRSSRSSRTDRKSTRLNSSHGYISYAVFCLKKKKNHKEGICSLLYTEPLTFTEFFDYYALIGDHRRLYPNVASSSRDHRHPRGGLCLRAHE